jgi:prevent-host-death family protein
MQFSTQVKPISQLKSHAADILASLAESREPLVITQNGEARAVLMDVVSYEELHRTG